MAAGVIALWPALDEPMPPGERLLVWGCTYAVVMAIARVARLAFGRPTPPRP